MTKFTYVDGINLDHPNVRYAIAEYRRGKLKQRPVFTQVLEDERGVQRSAVIDPIKGTMIVATEAYMQQVEDLGGDELASKLSYVLTQTLGTANEMFEEYAL